ncbi:hypothetical protein ID866_8269 [Astraeus odoratus]|nr:hypothetical protein ID866_8269 [Astraeus odoratus]
MQPLEYVIKHLEAFKHVPPWYFTLEGLAKATRIVHQDEVKELLVLTQETEEALSLCPTLSISASKHAKYDHNLFFTEFLYAKCNFLIHIEHTDWPMAAVDTLNWFFYNLENHVLRQQAKRGERVLLHYASRVMTKWHDIPPANQFDLSIINKALMSSIVQELHSREMERSIAW